MEYMLVFGISMPRILRRSRDGLTGDVNLPVVRDVNVVPRYILQYLHRGVRCIQGIIQGIGHDDGRRLVGVSVGVSHIGELFGDIESSDLTTITNLPFR